jgi:hypothetical protein
MGHLILAQTRGEIGEAVKGCNGLTPELTQSECLGGVFMENLTREYLTAHGIAVKFEWTLDASRNIEKLCNQFQGLAQKVCWREISYIFASIARADPKQLFYLCSHAPAEDMAASCYIQGGANMVNYAPFRNENLPTLCSVFDTNAPRYADCTRQVLGSLIYATIKNFERATFMCLNIPLDNQSMCFSNLIDLLKKDGDFRTYIEDACRKAPKGFINDSCPV